MLDYHTGDGAWAMKTKPESHGRSHSTAAFYSSSHLEVQDI